MVVAATGFFDGVHLGHRVVLDKVKEVASSQGKKSAVITFWPHPRSVLQKDADVLRLLNSLEGKRELIKSLGIDELIVLPFSKEFSQLSQKDFMQKYLIEKYQVSSLVVGYDHKVGKDAHSSPNKIIEVARSLGMDTFLTPPLDVGEKAISSTRIKNLLLEGRVKEASAMLGYNYPLKGVVVSGNRIGRTIGFPTANMQLYEPIKLIPMKGVYVVKVSVLGGEYLGICNIGNRPTVACARGLTIETHILGFTEDIYGLDVKIEFVDKLRDEVKFDSLDFLKEQLNKDKQEALKFLV